MKTKTLRPRGPQKLIRYLAAIACAAALIPGNKPVFARHEQPLMAQDAVKIPSDQPDLPEEKEHR